MTEDKNESVFSSEELFQKYGKEETAESILDLWLLGHSLGECIIKDSYKSGPLGQVCSQLSVEGASARREFMKKLVKESEKGGIYAPTPNDANVMSLLTLFHRDLLLDIQTVKPRAIAREMGEEIKSRKLLFPFAFGRDLYDAMFKIQTKEVRSLEYTDTIRLLDHSLIGVFHVGRYLFGPFGMIETRFRRSIPPRKDLKLQHSSDRTNRSAHRVWLSSSARTPVNAYRSVFEDALHDMNDSFSDWAGFFKKIASTREQDYDAESEASIPYFIGDAFSDKELRNLACEVCEDENIRNLLPDNFVARIGSDDGKCSRSELIQAIFCASDTQLRQIIDRQVFSKKLLVSDGEIRKPVLNGKQYLGQWGTHFELGRYGTRVVGMFPGLPELRLKDMLRAASEHLGKKYQDNLKWVLRDINGSDLNEQLSTLVATEEPINLLSKAVLPYSDATEFALKYVNMDLGQLDSANQSAEVLLNLLSWRLGFKERSQEGAYSAFVKSQKKAMNDFPSSPEETAYEYRIRGALAQIFSSLEKYLKELLTLLTWALLADHYKDGNPFEYTPEKARLFANSKLLGKSKSVEDIDSLTLNSLIQEFSHLANILRRLNSDKDNRRLSKDYPAFHDRTTLQLFPLHHMIPFLDLRQDAQKSVIDKICIFEKSLEGEDIVDVRNGYLHGGRKKLPDASTVRSCVETIHSSVQHIELDGLGLSICSYRKTEMDPWGRAIHKLIDETGTPRTILEPSDLNFMGLPGPEVSQIILTPARMQLSDESLRFSVGSDSEYSKYWSGFPRYSEPSEILGVEKSSLK
ncbi:MAG: hypothetical protein ABF545_06395 [Bifidobacterium psychraerophilum]|uniref:hypothetical protein n=1 Tax=Bifidobacterium psychraerophilum TaxID=218140 RepID=UPI0039EA0F0E